MEKSKFEYFETFLLKGDYEGVRKTLVPEFLEKIINNNCKSKPIHCACENSSTDIVKLLVDQKCKIESEDKYKMRPIHYAVETGNIDIVRLLIQQKCNIEIEDKFKERPIHLACWKGHIDIVRLLIAQNCMIDVRDEDGWTPLDLAKERGHEDIVTLIEDVMKIPKKIRDSIINNDEKVFAKLYKPDILTGLNWIEIALEKKSNKIIKYFLKRHINAFEIRYIRNVMKNNQKSTTTQLWLEVLLYKCIRDHHEEGFQLICCADIINGHRKIIPHSFLEVAAEHGNSVFVQEILKKSSFDSETWEKAKGIASKKGYRQIHDSISNRKSLLNSRQRANFSILHTAVCDNDPDMIEYILNRSLVDPNQNHETLGSPLALAILLCHEKCITVLKQFTFDCNTQNKYLDTPLHMAISNGMIDCCRYLIDHSQNIDQSGFMGMTALHCAVMRGYEELCDQMVEKGADCIQHIEILQTFNENKGETDSQNPLAISKRENALTLCAKINKTIYPCFLKSLNKNESNSCDDEGNSLLHLTAQLLNSELCLTLIVAGGDVNSVNKQDHNPISELLSGLDNQTFDDSSDKIVELVNLFVQNGYNINKRIKENRHIMEIAVKFNCERLLLCLLSHPQSRSLDIDENLFRHLLEKGFYQVCVTLLDLFQKYHEKSSTTIIKEIPLLHDHKILINFLLLHINIGDKQSVVERVLYHLTQLKDKDCFECLLNIEIMEPHCLENGETLLTSLLKEHNFNFCQKIFESRVNNKKYLNLKNRKNQTPLQTVIETESMDMVQYLIFKTENLDNEDSDGHTALSQLFVKISHHTDQYRHLIFLNAIKVFILLGQDIYHKTRKGDNIIKFLSSLETRKEIESFYNNYRQNNLKQVDKGWKHVICCDPYIGTFGADKV